MAERRRHRHAWAANRGLGIGLHRSRSCNHRARDGRQIRRVMRAKAERQTFTPARFGRAATLGSAWAWGPRLYDTRRTGTLGERPGGICLPAARGHVMMSGDVTARKRP